MRNLFKIAGLLALTGFISSCNDKETTANYQVIPLPQEITTAQSQPFTLNGSVKIIYPEGNEKMQRNAQFLANYLKKATGKDYAVEAGTEGKGAILLKLGMESENPEAYQLSVNADGVTIAAPTEAGVFYGIQTLRKSIPVAIGTTPSLPAVEINDYPRFSYRGAHFDVGRHFFTVDEVKTYIDMMALHNMNRLHWHLTEDQGWRLEIKKYPKLTEIGSKRSETVIGRNSGEYDGKPYGGFYTQEEAKEIVAYAADRYITVIPEIDLPGHMQGALAAYPHLGCTGGPYEVWKIWGVSDQVLCAGNDSVLTFIDDVLTEVMEIFPSEYIHVGGDECPKTEWAKCPKCQARIKALGIKSDAKHSKEEYLQSFVINHAEKFLNEHGRQIIGWDEILEGGLAPNATVMSWRGEEGGIKAAKAGHDVIMTPGGFCYLDSYQDAPMTQPEAIGGYLTLEKVYSYDPIPEVLTKEGADYIQGVQANVWAEYITTAEHMEYMVYPRLLALAEVAWTQPDKKNWEHFHRCALKEVKWLQDNGYHPFDLSKEVGERPEAAIPVEHLGLMKTVKYTSPYAPQYTPGGDSALVDGLRGGWTYGDKRWQGFLNTDMDITVDLGEMKEISSIAAEFMQLSGPYVWLPREVIISISEDGNTFTEQARLHTDVPTTEDRLVFRTYEWDGKASVRYVRYQALSNGIEGGWLFPDEIVIK